MSAQAALKKYPKKHPGELESSAALNDWLDGLIFKNMYWTIGR